MKRGVLMKRRRRVFDFEHAKPSFDFFLSMPCFVARDPSRNRDLLFFVRFALGEHSNSHLTTLHSTHRSIVERASLLNKSVTFTRLFSHHPSRFTGNHKTIHCAARKKEK
jgi:hypothetical protein